MVKGNGNWAPSSAASQALLLLSLMMVFSVKSAISLQPTADILLQK